MNVPSFQTTRASMKFNGVLAFAATAALVFGAAGCAVYAPPQAWEKGALAKKDMAMSGDALEQQNLQHVYASKENASGGSGVGGGGCGCN